jgi:hypothetical protein
MSNPEQRPNLDGLGISTEFFSPRPQVRLTGWRAVSQEMAIGIKAGWGKDILSQEERDFLDSRPHPSAYLGGDTSRE